MTKSFTVEQLRCLELARIIREGLEGVRFDMQTFRGYCGTAGCLAGYAIAVYAPELWAAVSACDIKLPAQRLLGLTDRQAEELFYVEGVNFSELKKITPAMAAATLENYALTGKVEWPEP